jgi:hypothetical protein
MSRLSRASRRPPASAACTREPDLQSFSELTGRDLWWRGDVGHLIQNEAEHHHRLLDAGEPAATAKATWKRLAFFDLAPESGEGTYVVFAPGGSRLITVSGYSPNSIGGNPGHMLIAPEVAAAPKLPALVGLSFALANEQVMLLHRSAPPSVTRRSSY